VERTANFVKLITTLSIFASFCALAQAQPQRSGGRQGQVAPHSGPPPAAPHSGPPSSVPSTRERWLSLPPAARQDFQRNAERWTRMSPEERNILRQRENLRQAQIKRETEAALRDSGLRLDQEKRSEFESRYIQERRKIEQGLRQQIETERQKEIPALIQQLRKEFQLEPGGGATAKPAELPKSGK
jgi:hypothetical protein